jgi:hypothetical protein
MQFALQQYGVNPTDLANTQYAAAQATAHAANNPCAVPHGADLVAAQARLQAELQAQAARQAAQKPAQKSSQSGSGTATTADSLPPDPSKHP